MGRILLMDGKVIMIINEIEIMFFNVYYVEYIWFRICRINLNKYVEYNIIGYFWWCLLILNIFKRINSFFVCYW